MVEIDNLAHPSEGTKGERNVMSPDEILRHWAAVLAMRIL